MFRRIPYLLAKNKGREGAPYKVVKRLPTTIYDITSTEAKELPTKLKVNFFSPNEIFAEEIEADQIILSSATQGQIGILPGHVPIVTPLKPSVVAITTGNQTKKVFVSGGFALVKNDSVVDIAVAEGFDLTQFDATTAHKLLEKHQTNLAAPKDEMDRIRSQIAVDVMESLNEALKAEGIH
eukprot:TRINITY_DN978_c0_g1_i1.p1 TRINITY_DN978_c0_g1~~TRINITY_DN978_c0_g1_i1.p1  ORF type:complete len:181 (-),score=90.53 TRINITY_DN978_c0_g1_i1:82-624(-)